MLDRSTEGVIEHTTKFSQAFKPNVPKLPEQNRGTLPRLQYGDELGITREGHDRVFQPSSWETESPTAGNRAFQPSSWETESPTANKNSEYTHKNPTPYLSMWLLLGYLAEVVQSAGNRAFQLSSWETESPTANTDLESRDKNTNLREIFGQLDIVARWREDRNEGEHEPEKPSKLALTRAKRVVKELLDAADFAGHPCHTPFISYDQDGYIAMVWRNGKHELYLEITEDEIQYVKVWGINIASEMDAGVPSKDNYLTLWEWLLNG